MGMANYVDRDLLLKVLIHRVKGNEDNFIVLGTNNTLSLVEDWVRSIEPVDAVPVVRCKDCTWCEKGKSYEPYCNHPTDGMYDVQMDDFCSYGERRTDARKAD